MWTSAVPGRAQETSNDISLRSKTLQACVIQGHSSESAIGRRHHVHVAKPKLTGLSQPPRLRHRESELSPGRTW